MDTGLKKIFLPLKINLSIERELKMDGLCLTVPDEYKQQADNAWRNDFGYVLKNEGYVQIQVVIHDMKHVVSYLVTQDDEQTVNYVKALIADALSRGFEVLGTKLSLWVHQYDYAQHVDYKTSIYIVRPLPLNTCRRTFYRTDHLIYSNCDDRFLNQVTITNGQSIFSDNFIPRKNKQSKDATEDQSW